MAGQLDLTLPATAPTMAQYHHTPGSMEPAALYTLVDLPDDELLDLQHECEIECIETGNEPNASVRPAPQSRFVGQPLRAVFDYHLELGAQKTYDPRYFIVAIDKDWKKRGVLLVTLDDDDLECKVDSFRIKASESGLTILNLQIANVNWDEEKENLALHTDDEEVEDDKDNDGDPAPKDVPTQAPSTPTNPPPSSSSPEDNHSDTSTSSNLSGPRPPPTNHPLGFYIALYLHPALSPSATLAHLEPGGGGGSPHPKPFSAHAVRVQGALAVWHAASPATVLARAFAAHPLRCAKNPFLHRTLLLVVDTAAPRKRGMLIARLDWDGAAAVPRRALRAVGASAPRDAVRVPYGCEGGGVVARFFLPLARGEMEWAAMEGLAEEVMVRD